MLPRRMNHVDSGAMKRILACALAVFALTAYAQTYPSRPIKFVAPFPPGGSSDVLCRLLGAKLAEGLGQPVTVENRPGAAASIGHQYAAQQPPDGYTIVITSSSTLVNNLYLYKHQAFDVFTDFAPISMIASAGQVLVVHPSVPAKSVQDVINLAKKDPGKWTYASSGNGTSIHMSGAMFTQLTGTDIVHIPYKGSAPAITDLLAGQTNMMFDNIPSALPHIKSGKLRAIATTGAKRDPALPDLPTVAESGVKGYESGVWFGIMVPAATPRDIVMKLNAAAVQAAKAPEFVKRMRDLGYNIIPGTPEQMASMLKEEVARWAPIVKASGAKVD